MAFTHHRERVRLGMSLQQFATPCLALSTFALIGFFLAPASAAQGCTPTIRASVDSAGNQGNFASTHPSLSADGRFVAFNSMADNLVPGDTNGYRDIFVHDCLTRLTTIVSVDSAGNQGNEDVVLTAISEDGRHVAFASLADNLVPGDTNGVCDIFLHDRDTGQTYRVSLESGGNQANANCIRPTISTEGRYVAFHSIADNLVAGDTNGSVDVFVHDCQTGETTRVSVDSAGAQGNSHSMCPSISGDGSWVAFESLADNLVLADTNGVYDAFVHNRLTGKTIRVSVDSSGNQANGDSSWVELSADGRYVVFHSLADNLVPGDTNGVLDVFVHALQTSQTTRVSVDSGGTESNGKSYDPYLSGDGRYVAFCSEADNLVPGDANDEKDVFVHDQLTGLTTMESVDSSGNQGDDASLRPAISPGGCHVAFVSIATNLVPDPTNGSEHVYVHRRECAGCSNKYCTAKINSLGCLPTIQSMGTPTLTGPDDFHVIAGTVLNNKYGIMIWSHGPNNLPFMGGTLCVAPPIVRTPVQDSGGNPPPLDCSGTYFFHFSQAYMASKLIPAGTQLYAQYWSRDPGFAPPENVGLTDGLEFLVGP